MSGSNKIMFCLHREKCSRGVQREHERNDKITTSYSCNTHKNVAAISVNISYGRVERTRCPLCELAKNVERVSFKKSRSAFANSNENSTMGLQRDSVQGGGTPYGVIYEKAPPERVERGTLSGCRYMKE